MAGVNSLQEHPFYRDSDIPLTTTSGVHASTIAEYVIAVLLALAHRVPRMVEWHGRKAWPPDADPRDCTLRTVPGLVAQRGDPHAAIDDRTYGIETLLEWHARDEREGLQDLPYPPDYPKMPGEPKRVQPSRARP